MNEMKIFVESPSAMMKSYLWVADPRQVTFHCLSKEKVTKRKDTPEPPTLSRYTSRSAGKSGAHIPVRPFALPLAALTLRFSP